MALNLANADQALKEDYQPAVREQLNNENKILMQMESSQDNIVGRFAVVDLHLSRNSGVGARADGGTLPTAGNQGYQQERVPVLRNYGRIQVTGPTIAAMKSDAGSFVRAVDSEVKGVTKDLKRDVNRQIFGTSNGVIATCGTTTTSNTVQLAAATTEVQMRQLADGVFVVDIGTVANPTSIASARTITATDAANLTITIDGATVSTTGAAFVFRSGSGGATGGAGQKELTGLQTIVKDSGSLFNVDPSTFPVWKSYVSDNSGVLRSPADTLFEKAADYIGIASGEDPNLVVTTHGVMRGFAATLKSQKRFNDTTTLKGGFSALTVSVGDVDLAFVKDRDCPTSFAYVLNTKHLRQDVMSDWQWMDQDGAVLSRVPNQDAYEATLFKYHEITTDQRNAHGVIKDLQES